MSMSLKVIEWVPGDFGSEFKGLRCFLLTCHVIHENHETEYDGKELVFHHCSDRFLLIYYTYIIQPESRSLLQLFCT